jgi:hypothetical protein
MAKKAPPPNLPQDILDRRSIKQAAKKAAKAGAVGAKPTSITAPTQGVSQTASTFSSPVSGQGVTALKTETTRLTDALVQLKDLLTAKGSIWAASAEDTPGGLDVGANDTILVADSAQTLGVKWQALSSFTALTEAAQDAVGTILVDSSRIDFTYADATPSITADVIADSISNTYLSNMAESTVKGRAAGAGTGDPTDLTATQVVAVLETITPYVPRDYCKTVSVQSFTVATNEAMVLPSFEVGDDDYSVTLGDGASITIVG